MEQKEFMKEGARVIASGMPGKITRVTTYKAGKREMVYDLNVLIDGLDKELPFLPENIEPHIK